MNYNLIIIKQPPYLGRISSEIIEAIMSLALFDVPHKVIFFADGIQWLLTDQSPSEQKSLEKQLKALPIYGSDELFYCQEHCGKLFPKQELSNIAEPETLENIIRLIKNAQHVEVF